MNDQIHLDFYEGGYIDEGQSPDKFYGTQNTLLGETHPPTAVDAAEETAPEDVISFPTRKVARWQKENVVANGKYQVGSQLVVGEGSHPVKSEKAKNSNRNHQHKANHI